MTPEHELLRRMLELYSPTGEEHEVAALLVESFRGAGLDAGCDEAGNFVGTLGSGPVEVMLLGHIDTVPGLIPVEERGGRLYGRGAVDAKGPMASFVSAALRLAAGGGPRNLRLTLVGAVEEEGSSRGARNLVDRYKPRYLVIGEPGGWESVVLGYKGSLRMSYVLERPTQHTARPEESVAATAVGFWNRLAEAAAARNEGKRVFDQLSPHVRSINTSSDGFIERVEMDISVRLPLDFGPEQVESLLPEWAEDARLEISYGDPAVKGSKNNPLVRAFLSGVRECGGQPVFKVKTGTSDMNVVVPRWGCDAVAYGPGDSDLDHTPHEHIELEEYCKAIEVLAAALKQLDEVEAR